MFALPQWIRERSSSFVAACAVASLALGSAPAAQCGDEAVLHHLDAGTSAPVLRTPKGAAVIGGGFSLRVFDAAPSSTGILFYGAFDSPVFDPLLGATVWPAMPWFTKSFGTSAQGISGAQFNTTVVTDDLCGAFATFQAVVADPNAPSGFTITNAVRLRVGIVTEPVFRPLEETAAFNDVVFADVDGDALRDQVVAAASSFSVSLGLPTGGFDAPVTYGGVGGSTRAPLVADLDGDGNTDLIDASGDVGVILLDASLGVISATSFDAGPSVTDGALGDFDQDGALDLVVTLQGGGLGWMEGVGDGSLSFPQAIVVGGNATQVEAALIDGDGLLDLVVSTSATVVALGNGDGTFTALAPTGPVGLGGLSVLDLDLDGELDVAGFSGKTLGVQLGNGDGSLGSLQSHIAAAEFLKDYVLADLDGDGLREAIAVPGHVNLENVFVSQGLPGGQFGAPVEFGGLHNPKALAVADMDLDGALDVLIVGFRPSAPTDSRTLTLRGLGDGSLDANRVTAVGKTSNRVVSGNLNGDAFADAVVLNFFSDDVSVLLGSPDGLTFHASFPTGPDPIYLDVAEFTGDPWLDIVVGDKSPGNVRVLPGDGSGNFGVAVVTPAPFDVRWLHHADFDEDGVRDVVVVRYEPVNNYNLPDAILLGNGDGTFGAATSLPVNGRVSVAGRVNGDAHVDLLVRASGSTVRLFGNGDGTFTAGTGFSFLTLSGSNLLADLDLDGDQDLLHWNSGFLVSANLHVGLNDGNGTFAFLTDSSVTGSGGLAVADFDEDGLPDVVLSAANAVNGVGSVQFLRGHGDGTFTLSLTVAAGTIATDVAAGDFDGDGILDVASIDAQSIEFSATTGRLWTLLNRVGE